VLTTVDGRGFCSPRKAATAESTFPAGARARLRLRVAWVARDQAAFGPGHAVDVGGALIADARRGAHGLVGLRRHAAEARANPGGPRARAPRELRDACIGGWRKIRRRRLRIRRCRLRRGRSRGRGGVRRAHLDSPWRRGPSATDRDHDRENDATFAREGNHVLSSVAGVGDEAPREAAHQGKQPIRCPSARAGRMAMATSSKTSCWVSVWLFM